MKISLLFIILYIFSFNKLIGQEFGGEFNELPEPLLKSALEMRVHKQDSLASAIILYDLGEIVLVPNGTNHNYLRRIKIFKKSAYSDWANVTLYAQKLGFTKINGFTSNLENGQIVKTPLDESQIFKSSYNKEWDKYIFTMPNVKEGAVIEYTWKSKLNFYTLPWWKFQHSVPVLWSQYDLINTEISFRADLGGELKATYENIKKRRIHRWTLANVPAFKDEPFMPNDDLFSSQLYLWSYRKSWDNAVEYWRTHKYYGRVFDPQDFLLPIAREVGGGPGVAPRNRIKNLVGYLKSQVSWNGVSDYLSDDPEEVLKLKKGSSGDINLTLASLLANAGISVNYVLISTRDNGHYHEEIPTMQQFNYLICQAIIGTDTLYVDATRSESVV